MLQSIADQSSIRDGGGSRQVEWGDDEEFEEDFDPNLPYPGYDIIDCILSNYWLLVLPLLYTYNVDSWKSE